MVGLIIRIDNSQAVKELDELLTDLESAGLHTEVRAGHEKSLLIFVKAPRELLGNMVYKSR
jgi:anoctamin-10